MLPTIIWKGADKRLPIVIESLWGWLRNYCSNASAPETFGARHAYSGREPIIVQTHENQMRTLLGRKPDMTLKELREALGLDCSLPAIHYALSDMGLTYKKRHSEPVNRTGPISGKRARGGGAAN